MVTRYHPVASAFKLASKVSAHRYAQAGHSAYQFAQTGGNLIQAASGFRRSFDETNGSIAQRASAGVNAAALPLLAATTPLIAEGAKRLSRVPGATRVERVGYGGLAKVAGFAQLAQIGVGIISGAVEDDQSGWQGRARGAARGLLGVIDPTQPFRAGGKGYFEERFDDRFGAAPKPAGPDLPVPPHDIPPYGYPGNEPPFDLKPPFDRRAPQPKEPPQRRYGRDESGPIRRVSVTSTGTDGRRTGEVIAPLAGDIGAVAGVAALPFAAAGSSMVADGMRLARPTMTISGAGYMAASSGIAAALAGGAYGVSRLAGRSEGQARQIAGRVAQGTGVLPGIIGAAQLVQGASQRNPRTLIEGATKIAQAGAHYLAGRHLVQQGVALEAAIGNAPAKRQQDADAGGLKVVQVVAHTRRGHQVETYERRVPRRIGEIAA